MIIAILGKKSKDVLDFKSEKNFNEQMFRLLDCPELKFEIVLNNIKSSKMSHSDVSIEIFDD